MEAEAEAVMEAVVRQAVMLMEAGRWPPWLWSG